MLKYFSHCTSHKDQCKSQLYLARLTLAFCPPLSVIPLSPTRVRSPSGNSSKSCVHTTQCIYCSPCHLPFLEHMLLSQCCTIQDYKIVQKEYFLLKLLSTATIPDWQMPLCPLSSHHRSEQEAPSIYTGASWTEEKF